MFKTIEEAVFFC